MSWPRTTHLPHHFGGIRAVGGARFSFERTELQSARVDHIVGRSCSGSRQLCLGSWHHPSVEVLLFLFLFLCLPWSEEGMASVPSMCWRKLGCRSMRQLDRILCCCAALQSAAFHPSRWLTISSSGSYSYASSASSSYSLLHSRPLHSRSHRSF